MCPGRRGIFLERARRVLALFPQSTRISQFARYLSGESRITCAALFTRTSDHDGFRSNFSLLRVSLNEHRRETCEHAFRPIKSERHYIFAVRYFSSVLSRRQIFSVAECRCHAIYFSRLRVASIAARVTSSIESNRGPLLFPRMQVGDKNFSCLDTSFSDTNIARSRFAKISTDVTSSYESSARWVLVIFSSTSRRQEFLFPSTPRRRP